MNSMRTLTWSIWQRNHRWLLAIAAYFIIYSQVIVTNTSEQHIPTVFAIGSLLLVFCYLALIGIFMYQDTDVGVRGSAYPLHMLTLPVRTYKLVFVPMIIGTLTFLGSGIAVCYAIQRSHPDFPLFWPAFLISGILAMLQALFWYPLGIPYSKLILTLIALPTLVYFVAVPLSDKVSERVVCQYLGLLIAASYAIAYHGVVRARRGEIQLFTINSKTNVNSVRKNVKWLNFANASAAQRWYEWRQQGLVLPCLVLFICAIFSIEVYLQTGLLGPVRDFGPNKDGLYIMVWPLIYAYFPQLLSMVPIAALIVGCGARRTDIKHADRTFLLFFGTRPMSDCSLVASKLRLALRSAFVAWTVLFVQILLLLPLRAGLYNPNDQVAVRDDSTIFSVLLSYMTPDFVLKVICFFFIMICLTWRNYAIGFWTELSGKTWLRYGYPFGMLLLIFGGYIWAVSPAGRRSGMTQEHVLTVIWCLNILRIILSVVLIRGQVYTGILNSNTILKNGAKAAILIACIISAVLFCSVGYRADMNLQLHYSIPKVTAFVVGLTLLWTPIVRLLLATEMLHQNRHRA